MKSVRRNIVFEAVVIGVLCVFCVQSGMAGLEDDLAGAVQLAEQENYGDFTTPGTALYLFNKVYNDSNCGEALKVKSALGISKILSATGPYNNALAWANTAIAENKSNDHDLLLDAYMIKGYLYFKKMKKNQKALDEYSVGLAQAPNAPAVKRIKAGLMRAKCQMRLFQRVEPLISVIQAMKEYRLKDLPYDLGKPLRLTLPPLAFLKMIIHKTNDKQALLTGAGWGAFQSYLDGLQDRSIQEDVLLAFVHEQDIAISQRTDEEKRAIVTEALNFCSNLKTRMNQTTDVAQEMIIYINKNMETYNRYLYGIDASVSQLTGAAQQSDTERAYNRFLALKALYEANGPDAFAQVIQSEPEEEIVNMMAQVNVQIDGKDSTSFRVFKAVADRAVNCGLVHNLASEQAAQFKLNCARVLAYSQESFPQAVQLLQSVKDDESLLATETGAAMAIKAREMHEAFTEIQSIEAFRCAMDLITHGTIFYHAGKSLITHLSHKIIDASEKSFYTNYLNDSGGNLRMKMRYQYYVGLSYSYKKEHQKAIDVLSAAVDKYRNDEYAPVTHHHYILMAMSYLELENKEKACEVMEGIEGSNSMPKVLQAKAVALMATGRISEAKEVLQQILTVVPETKLAEHAHEQLDWVK